ncbi:MAG: hypothetical protein WC797_03835 [Candidatus Paceibacterota bacterium]|jgi:hypothetical protein
MYGLTFAALYALVLVVTGTSDAQAVVSFWRFVFGWYLLVACFGMFYRFLIATVGALLGGAAGAVAGSKTGDSRLLGLMGAAAGGAGVLALSLPSFLLTQTLLVGGAWMALASLSVQTSGLFVLSYLRLIIGVGCFCFGMERARRQKSAVDLKLNNVKLVEVVRE